MKLRLVTMIVTIGFGMVLAGAGGLAQGYGPATQQPATRGPAENGSPAWFLQGSFPSPQGYTKVDAEGHVTVLPRPAVAGRVTPPAACSGDIAKYCSGQTGNRAMGCLRQNNDNLSAECTSQVAGIATADGGVVPCSHSPVCANRMTNGVEPSAGGAQRVEWQQTLGYIFTYPYFLPEGIGGVPSVALDSRGDLWVFKQAPAGTPQLYEFGPDHKIIRTVGEDVIGHAYRAHGMAVDAHDNVWVCEMTLAIVEEVSPEGKLLKTIGVRGHRGDWDEAKGQRLLWQPVAIAFAPSGDIYIGEGHGNDSPNDTDSPDPTNVSGAARVIHLDKDGNFVNQWYGNNTGQGKFSMAHDLAIDPRNGDVWIGDREQYRIVVYTANGQFIKTLQMTNLVCDLKFDPEGNPWMGSGDDGQFLKLDRNGRVLGAIGNGSGIGTGQFIETGYWVFDKQDNLYAGDTYIGRVTVMAPPKK